MNITFLRHATAVDDSDDDFNRELNEKGWLQIEAVAKFCTTFSLCPQTLITSPYPRALQTATRLSELVDGCPQPVVVDWLQVGTRTDVLSEVIREQIASTEDLWLVGHEPAFSETIALLTGGGNVKVRKASLTQLMLNNRDDCALLSWSLPCKMMRKLTKAVRNQTQDITNPSV